MTHNVKDPKKLSEVMKQNLLKRKQQADARAQTMAAVSPTEGLMKRQAPIGKLRLALDEQADAGQDN